MNNIAEGFGRFSDKEFIRFLDISQSSAQEVLSMTYVLIDMEYVNDKEFRELQSKIIDTRNLVLGLIKYLRGKWNVVGACCSAQVLKSKGAEVLKLAKFKLCNHM